MARASGRNLWIAVPAGLLCTAVVAALAYFALPMVPVSVAWAGDMLRAATTPKDPGDAAPPITAAEHPDCRDLYPDDLWAELVWTPGALLGQSIAVPDTMPAPLVEALSPTVLVTCTWRIDDGRRIVSTLARMPADAGPIAEAALRGDGFACRSLPEGGLTCSRSSGVVDERHELRGGVLLSVLEQAWHPLSYGDRVAAHVWG